MLQIRTHSRALFVGVGTNIIPGLSPPDVHENSNGIINAVDQETHLEIRQYLLDTRAADH
jgi:hypothetical protein